MANAFSPLRQYGDYIQPYNFDLLAKGLEYKQTRFDANVAMLQQQIDQFANVDVMKPEDKQYLASRVNDLVDGINRTSSMSSFDSAGVTRNLQGQIKNVFDENVMNAVSSTANARRLQSEIADIKKNKPTSYAAQNEMFATRGLKQYLSDGEVGSVYNGGSYTPFYNIQKELLPIMKNLHQYADVEKRTTPDGNGYYVTTTGKRVTPEEVRRIAESVLPAQGNTQLQIDGWYNFGRGENALEVTRDRFERFKNDSLSTFDARVADLSVRISALGKGQGAEREALQRELTTLNNNKDSIKSTYDSWLTSGDIDNMSFTLQKNKLMDGLGARYGFTETELSYSTDQSFWKAQELQYKTAKSLLDRTKKKDSNQDNVPDIRTQVVPTENPEDEFNLIEDTQQTIETNTLRRDKLVNDKFASLPSNIRGNIDVLYENRTNEDITKEDFLFDYFRKLSQDSTSSGLITIDEFEQMNSSNNIVLSSKKTMNEAFTDAVKENEAEIFPQIFDVAKTNPGIKIDINGQAVPINDYFSSIGVSSYEELENNPEELTRFKKQVYADLILSKETDDPFAVRQLAAMFGEGEEDVPEMVGIEFIHTNRGAVPRKTFEVPNDSNTMPETMAFLNQVRRSGSFDTSSGFTDDSFQDDRTSNKLLDPDDLRNKTSSILAGRKTDLPQQNEFLLQSDTDVHNQLMAVVNGQTEGSFLAVKTSPFTIAMDPADGGSIIVKQKIKEGTIGGARNISENEAKIPIQNLPPDIIADINFNNQRPIFNSGNFVPKERGDVRFIDEVNSTYLDELGTSVFDNNQELMQVSTQQGAALALFKAYPDVLGGFNQSTSEVGTIIKNVLSDNRFAVTMNPTKNRNGIRLGVQYDTGANSKSIFSPLQPVTIDNLDKVNKIVDYAPQVVIYNMLNAMLTDIRLNGGQVPNGTLEKLKSIYPTDDGRRQ